MTHVHLPTLVAALAAVLPCLGCSGDQKAAGPAGGAASSGAGAPAGTSTPPAAVAAVPDEFPRFVPQEGWVTEAVTNSMRLHQYRLPGAEGQGDVEVAVASWPGGIGPREENLTRWATQVGVAKIEPAQRWETDVRQFRVTLVHLEGAYKPDQGQALDSGAALLAAWIEVPGEARVWTVKATGPAGSVQRWKGSFEAFIAAL